MCFKFAVFIAFVLSVLAGPVVADSQQQQNAEPYRPLEHLWQGTRDIPNPTSAVVFAAGSALTLGALAFDHSVQNFFAGHRRLGDWGKIGDDFLGTGAAGAMVGAGTLAFGLLKPSRHEIDAGQAHLEALIAIFAYTEILKYSVRRPRPDSSNRLSFPSGHASTAFTSAASITSMYGPAWGVPAFVLAAFTGTARLAANAHHLSDVLFGATLGTVVGYSYTLHHRASDESQELPKTSWLPFYESRDSFGLNAQMRF